MNLVSKSEGNHGKVGELRRGQKPRTSVIRTGNRSKVMKRTLMQH